MSTSVSKSRNKRKSYLIESNRMWEMGQKNDTLLIAINLVQ